MQYHPDRNKEPGAEERFKEIAAAYAVLSDPKKRADYDARGFAGVADFSAQDLFGGIDFDDIFGGLGFGAGGGLFERFFGRRTAGPPRGANIEVGLEVSLERIRDGGEEKVHYRRPADCAACGGSGAKAGTSPRSCDRCGGNGRQVRTERQKGGVTFQQITTCPACGGAGKVIEEKCPGCAGQGRIERTETLSVKIPPGIEEGAVLRVAGHGIPAPGAGIAGDLYVVVRSAPDHRFVRSNADLWRTETIAVADAVLGTELQVPVLDGAPVTVKVTAGTQPGTVLRLHGKGLPEFGKSRHGDMLVRIAVHVPERTSSAERALYERLRELNRSKR